MDGEFHMMSIRQNIEANYGKMYRFIKGIGKLKPCRT